jgi:hypothetical protein
MILAYLAAAPPGHPIEPNIHRITRKVRTFTNPVRSVELHRRPFLVHTTTDLLAPYRVAPGDAENALKKETQTIAGVLQKNVIQLTFPANGISRDKARASHPITRFR